MITCGGDNLIQYRQCIMTVVKQWPKPNKTGLGSSLWTLVPNGVIWCIWSITNKVAIFYEASFLADATTKRIKASLWAWIGH
ncbi:hypothetical protein FRX31_020908 [Thalictrum thalictroides]|uniref:Uncharacterized protein n=1 Tax=Thalictrum thalictroides TaxID=46969 RepID=A0A7J6VZI5_THATH|nr:hypothetical protein FRX31_020908 [Thalictrum thalictroides]